MTMSKLTSFEPLSAAMAARIQGGTGYCPPPPPPPCPPVRQKGNNGLGNGDDPPPPGLAVQPRADFNDGADPGPGNPGARGGAGRK